MSASTVFDLCVIGAGLIGSAAARHASQWGKVCLVGPEEPQGQRTLSDEREIYGAHYDEGKLTRSIANDPVWATLAEKSISRYISLEKESGIDFFTEVGSLVVGTQGSLYMSNVESVVKEHKLKAKRLTFSEMKRKFPYLNIAENDCGFLETLDAGYISPRKLVKAQITVALKNECCYIPEVASNVRRVVKNGEYTMVVKTESTTIIAKKVLIATGAFTSFRNILPDGIQLDLSLCPIAVAKVEISASDYENLRTMPGMIYQGKGAYDWTPNFPRDQGDFSWYMLPPVLYPDGRYYIKLGPFAGAYKHQFTTIKEMKEWYCSYGPKDLIDSTADLITKIIKGFSKVSHHGDCCVITETPTSRPYIDMIHAQLGVAVGGNGYAAKSSDEIGRLAATMVMKNKWDSKIPQNVVRVVSKEQMSNL